MNNWHHKYLKKKYVNKKMFIQVVREVTMAKEYMDWLVEESGD